jgi:hypothetical protein
MPDDSEDGPDCGLRTASRAATVNPIAITTTAVRRMEILLDDA